VHRDSGTALDLKIREIMTAHPGTKKYDLVVIGSGPAGEKGAAQAAYFGKRVAIIERAPQIGGASTNTGTLPSKTLRESALYFSGLRQRGLYGIDYSIKEGLTVKDFMFREEQVVARQRKAVTRNLADHKIDLILGEASFLNGDTVLVRSDGKDTRVQGEKILVATGSRPNRPDSIPFDDKLVYDSDSILRMDRIPGSMVVIGGGVIGCEYASIFAALGVKITLIETHDRLLPFLDMEISLKLKSGMERIGVEMCMEERLEEIARQDDAVSIRLESGKTLEAGRVLFAAGRRGNTGSLNLQAAGVELDDKCVIKVDDKYQTSNSTVLAAGDVIGFPGLASTSMEQARVAVCHAFGFRYKQQVASLLPYGIYAIPEVSAAGETEESCKAKGIEYLVGRARYENNARGQIIGDSHGLLKLIFSPDDLTLLGVHCVGEGATEQVHLGLMVLMSGGGIDTFIDAVFNFPTLAMMYKYAAYDGLGNLSGHKMREG
jgi:NAD(P) transhydrogenase